jgi:hypothetical protein
MNTHKNNDSAHSSIPVEKFHAINRHYIHYSQDNYYFANHHSRCFEVEVVQKKTKIKNTAKGGWLWVQF